jgi:hypothetical protein
MEVIHTNPEAKRALPATGFNAKKRACFYFFAGRAWFSAGDIIFKEI